MRANRASEPTVAAQPRSILQHAWSEIQHDLGHKSRATLPALVRRRFTRLAGLIELADQEFGDVREQLIRYGVLRECIGGIGDAADAIRLDKPALRAFIRDSRRVRRADREIARRLGSKLGRLWVSNTDVDELRDLNLQSIDAIDRGSQITSSQRGVAR